MRKCNLVVCTPTEQFQDRRHSQYCSRYVPAPLLYSAYSVSTADMQNLWTSTAVLRCKT
ncbi:unnamed protein product [Chondrus crispus]|uniref:Uncharacterized protein n=1 Tax=Chondrus crispus TaxID=2769 RepID=R7QET8_CHOCR|nr:unnamed protein product [Chondrus crispus]CDF36589.1 unnamed protein product [Chondrus crispus]|eukprot:XP_005716408.1 unnamed protein product [Chondrus crispus]